VFISVPEDLSSLRLLLFSKTMQANAGIAPCIIPLRFSSTSFKINYSLIILYNLTVYYRLSH
jgi:hypothetical protein